MTNNNDLRMDAIHHVGAKIPDVPREEWAPHFDRLYDAHASDISQALEEGDDAEEAMFDLTQEVRTAVSRDEKIEIWFP